jgi:hypothetical protein
MLKLYALTLIIIPQRKLPGADGTLWGGEKDEWWPKFVQLEGLSEEIDMMTDTDKKGLDSILKWSLDHSIHFFRNEWKNRVRRGWGTSVQRIELMSVSKWRRDWSSSSS